MPGALKRTAASRGIRAVVLSFNGDYAGYVLPDRYYDLGKYENRMSFHGPYMGSYLRELAEKTIGEVAKAKGKGNRSF
jgi:hypothetical protein